jgi:hypothetical protein
MQSCPTATGGGRGWATASWSTGRGGGDNEHSTDVELTASSLTLPCEQSHSRYIMLRSRSSACIEATLCSSLRHVNRCTTALGRKIESTTGTLAPRLDAGCTNRAADILHDPVTREGRAAAMAVENAAAAVLASSLKLVGFVRHCSPHH